MQSASQTKPAVSDIPDGELAEKIRATISDLNFLAAEAIKRELMVSYRIKPGEDGKAPRVMVNVMTEVA